MLIILLLAVPNGGPFGIAAFRVPFAFMRGEPIRLFYLGEDKPKG